MSSAHTVAPWVYSSTLKTVSSAANGDNIARVCEYGPQSETPNAQDANGKVLAAAFDMHATLELIRDSDKFANGTFVKELQRIAGDALAKITK